MYKPTSRAIPAGSIHPRSPVRRNANIAAPAITAKLKPEMATRWSKPKRVKALSHTEEFDKRQELIVEIERVMEECLDQGDVVQFEPDGTCTQNVTYDPPSR